MNGYRLPPLPLGLFFVIVPIADGSRAPTAAQQDATTSSLGFEQSVPGVFQDWEAGVLQMNGVSVCHARTTSTSHLVAGQPWPAPAELRFTEDRFDLKVVDVGREDGWGVVGADGVSGSELAQYLETLEAVRDDAAVGVWFLLDAESDDSGVGTARFPLRGFSEAHATSRAHCADERASTPLPESPAPIRSLSESGITETYRWGSLGPDPHVELVLSSPPPVTRGAADTVVIKARRWRESTGDELWISQADLEAAQADLEALYGELAEEVQLEVIQLGNLFRRGEAYGSEHLSLGHLDHWEVYRNGQPRWDSGVQRQMGTSVV